MFLRCVPGESVLFVRLLELIDRELPAELPMWRLMVGESGLAVNRRRLFGDPWPCVRRFVLGEVALL